MKLFFDTETTGLPDYRSPSDAPTQPHLVQLAMILTEDDGRERGSVSLIVKPEGWEIPPGASDIHGITTEVARSCGVSEKSAVELYRSFFALASTSIAHNHSFDERIMRIAQLRAGHDRAQIESNEQKQKFCTCTSAALIVNLPPTARMLAAGFNKPKPPKLEECMRHFFGEELTGAHDALVDVRACIRVYFELTKPREAA